MEMPRLLFPFQGELVGYVKSGLIPFNKPNSSRISDRMSLIDIKEITMKREDLTYMIALVLCLILITLTNA